MIKVVCIKEHENYPSIEKVGDILYLDGNTIFGLDDGEWYGEMYKRDDGMKFTKLGLRLLSRFKSVD